MVQISPTVPTTWSSRSTRTATAVFRLAASGFIQNSTSAQTANFNIQSAASGSIGAIITGASGQSVDILEVKANGVSNPVFAINSTGSATFRPSTGNDSTTAFLVQNS